LKHKLLLAKDNYGNTAWHRAAIRSRVQVLKTLWSLAKEAELSPHALLVNKNKERKKSRIWQSKKKNSTYY